MKNLQLCHLLKKLKTKRKIRYGHVETGNKWLRVVAFTTKPLELTSTIHTSLIILQTSSQN